jgi:hypothetical protein
MIGQICVTVKHQLWGIRQAASQAPDPRVRLGGSARLGRSPGLEGVRACVPGPLRLPREEACVRGAKSASGTGRRLVAVGPQPGPGAPSNQCVRACRGCPRWVPLFRGALSPLCVRACVARGALFGFLPCVARFLLCLSSACVPGPLRLPREEACVRGAKSASGTGRRLVAVGPQPGWGLSGMESDKSLPCACLGRRRACGGPSLPLALGAGWWRWAPNRAPGRVRVRHNPRRCASSIVARPSLCASVPMGVRPCARPSACASAPVRVRPGRVRKNSLAH